MNYEYFLGFSCSQKSSFKLNKFDNLFDGFQKDIYIYENEKFWIQNLIVKRSLNILVNSQNFIKKFENLIKNYVIEFKKIKDPIKRKDHQNKFIEFLLDQIKLFFSNSMSGNIYLIKLINFRNYNFLLQRNGYIFFKI